MSQHSESHADAHATHVHACPLWILGAVFAALIVLTVVTVLTAQFVDLGELNLVLAMAIALVKGALVAMFFMHLWWDSKFNTIALLAGLGFLAIFLAFALVDTHAYQNTAEPQETILTPAKLGIAAEAHGEGHAAPAGEHGKPAENAH